MVLLPQLPAVYLPPPFYPAVRQRIARCYLHAYRTLTCLPNILPFATWRVRRSDGFVYLPALLRLLRLYRFVVAELRGTLVLVLWRLPLVCNATRPPAFLRLLPFKRSKRLCWVCSVPQQPAVTTVLPRSFCDADVPDDNRSRPYRTLLLRLRC